MPHSTFSPTVAVTGAGGALGQALLKRWHERGARLIALTHSPGPIALLDRQGSPIPLRQVRWQVGEEEALADLLNQVDLLVINHGVNVYGASDAVAVERSLEVNALSAWRLLELFARQVGQRQGVVSGEPPSIARPPTERPPDERPKAEVWINTSEAEIQLAFSPLYEISKRLIGQLVSLRAMELGRTMGGELRIRRLVLGPFRSALNPLGPMGAGWVAGEILRQADWGCNLIIVTINPLTYLLMPLATMGRWVYFSLLRGSQPPLKGSQPTR